MLPEEVDGVDQTLDMWNGVLLSSFRWKGLPIQVETVSGDEGEDLLAARVRAEKPIPVVLRFPYPTGEHSDDASDWCADGRHRTEIVSQTPGSALLRRTVDGTVYHVAVRVMSEAQPLGDAAGPESAGLLVLHRAGLSHCSLRLTVAVVEDYQGRLAARLVGVGKHVLVRAARRLEARVERKALTNRQKIRTMSTQRRICI